MSFPKPTVSVIFKVAGYAVLAAVLGCAAFIFSLSSTSTILRLEDDERILLGASPASQHMHDSHGSSSAKNNVLVLGLPHSGADSIHEFFQCAGVTSSHYCCDDDSDRSHFPCGEKTCGSCIHDNLLNERPALEGCGRRTSSTASPSFQQQVFAGLDVETDTPFGYFLPQHFALPLLHEWDPNAVWVLNTRRDAETWAINIQHWFSRTTRMLNSFGIPYYSDLDNVKDTLQHEVTEETLYTELDRALVRAKNVTEHERRKRALMDIYKSHTDRVRRFVRHAKKNTRFIEINVDDDDDAMRAPVILANALGLDLSVVAHCWAYNADALDNDWKDFSIDSLVVT